MSELSRPEAITALRAAADVLETYVEFLHRLPASDLEQHPYIPTVEEALDRVLAALRTEGAQ